VSNEFDSGGVLRAARSVNWAAYSMPPSAQWYHPDVVPAAFELLTTASSEEEGRDAYNSMLFAVGNNHAGCLYPAAVPATPLIVRVAREHEGWQRWAALEILIECLAFDVDREQFTGPTGSVVHAKEAIIAATRDLHDDLLAMAQPQDTSPVATSARLIIEHLEIIEHRQE
jgi:hypothetical protein